MNRQNGFSLVEMMVAMVAGMILVGSVIAFTISTARSSSLNIASTRLNQDLRNVMDLTTRELRRAGYDDDAMYRALRTMGGAAFSPPFAKMQFDPAPIDFANSTNVQSTCIVFAYDRSSGTAGTMASANETRGLRRVTTGGIGAVEYNAGAAAVPVCDAAGADYSTFPPSCNATTGWCAVTDPRSLNVTAYTMTLKGRVSGGGTALAGVRNIIVSLSGKLVGANAGVTRTIGSEIRVRADCIKANLSNCNAAPGP